MPDAEKDIAAVISAMNENRLRAGLEKMKRKELDDLGENFFYEPKRLSKTELIDKMFEYARVDEIVAAMEEDEETYEVRSFGGELVRKIKHRPKKELPVESSGLEYW